MKCLLGRAPRPFVPVAALAALLMSSALLPQARADECIDLPSEQLRGASGCAGVPIGPLDGDEPAAASAAAPQEAAGFVLTGVRFDGNAAFGDEALLALVARWLGTAIEFADIERMSEALTEHYRRAGYVLAHVVAAPQEVSGGVVRFDVYEGRLGDVRVAKRGGALVPDALIEAAIAPLRRGDALRQDVLERAMLLLGDLPGLTPQASLEAGTAPGEFDLNIDMEASPRVVAGVDADNHGVRLAGEHRLGAFARINNPLGIGDSMDVRLARPLEHGQWQGRIAYETALPQPGLRAGIGYSRSAYALGEPYAALGAAGRAGIAELSLSYSLLRSRMRNLSLRIAAERKLLRDEFEALAQQFARKATVLGATLDFEGRDGAFGAGYSGVMLSVQMGRLSMESADAWDADQSFAGPHAQGRYARVLYRFARLQAIDGTASAFVSLSGQWANRNLDSMEKMAIGGPHGVRAYSTAAGLADEGQVLKLEYRIAPWRQATFYPFFDVGRARISHNPLPGMANHRYLRGAGLGMAWEPQRGLSLDASLAWPMGKADIERHERNPRLFAQIRKVF